MRHGPDDVRRISIFLAIVAIVLLFYAGPELRANPPSNVSTAQPLPPPDQRLTPLDFSDKFGSAVGGLAGLLTLALAVWQLPAFLRDQRRIAADLDRHPNVWIGLAPCRIRRDQVASRRVVVTDIVTTYREDRDYYSPFYVETFACNIGTRTARDLTWRFIFPPGVIVDGPTEPDDDGQTAVVTPQEYLHRFDSAHFRQVVYVPRSMKVLTYLVSVSLTDAPRVRTILRLNIRAVPEQPVDT